MKWSPDRVFIGVIGALGVYFVYRLATAPGDDAALPPSPPSAPRVPDVLLPTGASSPGAAPIGFPLLTGSPLHLTNSRAYRGRLETRGASPDEAIAILASVGFNPETIQIFTTPAEASPNVPAFALLGAGQGTRWFHARWLGKTIDVVRPAELALIWPVARAPTRA